MGPGSAGRAVTDALKLALHIQGRRNHGLRVRFDGEKSDETGGPPETKKSRHSYRGIFIAIGPILHGLSAALRLQQTSLLKLTQGR